MAKVFSTSVKASPKTPEIANHPAEEDALVADVVELGGPRPVVFSQQSVDEARIGAALEDWKRSTKLSVTVTGQSNVGKSLLINTLLEASAPVEYEHARRDNAVPSIEITSGDGDAVFGADGSEARYSLPASYGFSGPGSPDVSPPSSEKFYRTPDASPPSSLRFTAGSSSAMSTDSAEEHLESLRADLRHMGVDSVVKEYRKETGYSFEGNTIVHTASRSRRSSGSSELAPPLSAARAYKGFSVEEFLETSSRSAEHVYTPAQTPYTSMPATPGGSEISEVELDTRDGRRSTYKRATVYLFNGVSQSPDSARPQVNVVPAAARTFFPDEMWSSTIDWHKERQQSNDYQALIDKATQTTDGAVAYGPNGEVISSNESVHLPPVRIDDKKSYLLPQGQGCDVPQLVAVRYGRIPELIVSFPNEGELRLALWEVHEICILGTKAYQSEPHKRISETRYRKMLGLADDAIIPISEIDSPQDLPLDRDVSQLLGQNFRFAGLGKSLSQDRVFVREKLQEITTKYAYHMCKFLVRVPSSILDGNKELIEMSGPYIHGDFGTKAVLENTNLLLVAVDRVRGLSSDIVHLLQDSSLAHKLATKPELHKAIFVELAERYNLALPTEIVGLGTPSVDSFKQQLLDQWRQALLVASAEENHMPRSLSPPPYRGSALPSPSLSSPLATIMHGSTLNVTSANPNAMDVEEMPHQIAAPIPTLPHHAALSPISPSASPALFSASNSVSMRSAISEATLEQLVASTTVLEAKPTLFRSVHLQDDFPQELLAENDSTSVREVLKHTAIPELMSTIPNRLLAKTAVTVKQLSEAVLAKKYDVLGSSIASSDAQSRAESLAKLNASSNPSGAPESEATRSIIRLETRLSSFAVRVNSFKSELLTGARQMEPELSATAARSSAQLLSQYDPRTMAVDAVAALVRLVAARPLVESAQHAWRLAIAEAPSQAGMVLTTAQSLLSECASIIDIQFPAKFRPDAEQNARQMKLQEFMRSTNEECNKHMARFQEVLNQDVAPLAKDATIKTLQQHIIADPRTGRLSHVQDLPALCPKTATAIFARFNALIKSALNHIDALQQDVVRALRAVTFAIKTNSKDSVAASVVQASIEAKAIVSDSLGDTPHLQSRLTAWNAATTTNAASTKRQMEMISDTHPMATIASATATTTYNATAANPVYSETAVADAFKFGFSPIVINNYGTTTLNKLAAQNALNWPSSVATDDQKSQLYRKAEMELGDDLDAGAKILPESSEAQTASTMDFTSNVDLDHAQEVSSAMFISQTDYQPSSGDQNAQESERFGSDGVEHVLAPWADVKGVYSVLPQEESGVLWQYQLWEPVQANAASARLFFETLLRNSRISMGKMEGEYFSDANAQFKVLAQQVYGSAATHAIVRLLVCSEMLSNPDYYAHLLFQSRPSTSRMVDIQEYIALMSHEGCRGDNLTLCAFANFFGVDLLIFAPPFRQPILLRSRRSTSQAHLALVADQLKSTHLAAPFLDSASSAAGPNASPQSPGTPRNKAFCIAIMPDDEFAVLTPLKKRHMRHGSDTFRNSAPSAAADEDVDSEYERNVAHQQSVAVRANAGPTTGKQKHARMVQLRRAFDRRKAMESKIEPSSPNGSTFYRGENAYEEFDDSDDMEFAQEVDDEFDDGGEYISDSDASQAEIVRAIRPGPGTPSTPSSSSKKRKRNQDHQDDSVTMRGAVSSSVAANNGNGPGSGSGRKPRTPFVRQMKNSNSMNDVVTSSAPSSQQLKQISEQAEEELEDADALYRKKFKFATAAIAATPISAVTQSKSSNNQHNHASKTHMISHSAVTMDVTVEDEPAALSGSRGSGKSSSESGSRSGSVKMHPYDPILSNRVCSPPSLVDICLRSLVDGIESGVIPSLSGQVPEEYLQKVLLILSERKKLTDKNVARVLDPTMSSLMLYGPSAAITDITMTNVAHECHMLREVVIMQCPSVTTSGLTSLVSHCPLLEHLTIKGCAGVGNRALQEVARKCPRLEYIDASGCPQITDLALRELFVGCSQLTTVILQHCNQITDEAFAHYIGKHVQVLDLLECQQISNKTLVSVAHHCGMRLRILKLSGSGISDTGVIAVARECRELRVFELTHAENISDASAQHLWANCPLLFSVNLAHCRNVTNASFGPRLMIVDPISLAQNNFSDGDWAPKPALVFDMDNGNEDPNNMENGGMDVQPMDGDALAARRRNAIQISPPVPSLAFAISAHLTKLNLAMCLNVGDDALRHIAYSCPELRHLTISYCEDVSDVGLIAIALKCRDLRGLDITKCNKITNRGAKAIAERCPQLKRFLAGSVMLLSDAPLISLASNCPNLKFLDMCSTGITDAGLTAVARECRKLKLIAFSDCRFITSFGLSSFAECHQLEVIRLSGCKAIEDSTLLKLSIGCTDVMEIDLAGASMISPVILSKCISSWSKLVTLNLRGYTPLVRRQSEALLDPTFVEFAVSSAASSSSSTTSPSSLFNIRHPNLEDLNLSWCKFVDDVMITELAEGTPNLITLDLGWCTSITANAFHKLAQKCKNLRTLNLRGCTKIGPLSVQYLSTAPVVVYR